MIYFKMFWIRTFDKELAMGEAKQRGTKEERVKNPLGRDFPNYENQVRRFRPVRFWDSMTRGTYKREA
jgi:hypothetical protein